MRYKTDFYKTQKKMLDWWNNENTGRPIMRVVAMRDEPIDQLEERADFINPEEIRTSVEKNIIDCRNACKTREFLCEAYPNFSMDLGPGSLALYLGGEPGFAWDTVWFKENIHDIEAAPDYFFNPDNHWFKTHLDLIRKAVEMANGEFLVNIPDIIENIDILAALRGPQNLCVDIMDSPDTVKKLNNQINSLYFKYYDAFYDIVKQPDGVCSYTAFHIWGPGKVAKTQCDFNVLLSPDQFNEFVLPGTMAQCAQLDYSVFHVDGPDALRHVDSLCTVKDLNALQWTCGAGQPDGVNERWYAPIFEKAAKANKSTLSSIHDGDINDWIANVDKLVNTFGTSGLYLSFPTMSMENANRLIDHAETHWK